MAVTIQPQQTAAIVNPAQAADIIAGLAKTVVVWLAHLIFLTARFANADWLESNALRNKFFKKNFKLDLYLDECIPCGFNAGASFLIM